MKDRTCKHCDENYIPTGTRQLYCSHSCLMKVHYRKKKNKGSNKCRVCSGPTNSTYCTEKCRKDYNLSKRHGYPAHKRNLKYNWKKQGIINSDGSIFSWEDFMREYNKQNGVCKICNCKEILDRRLSVDHDHKTGLFRGILCNACNTALGKLKDSKELLLKALHYLEASSL